MSTPAGIASTAAKFATNQAKRYSCLPDTQWELHELINEHKLRKIDSRISEVEASDPSDPTARAQALADIVRLNKLRDRLDREIRHSFRQIQVKGE